MPRPNLEKAAPPRTVGDRHGPKTTQKRNQKKNLLGDRTVAAVLRNAATVGPRSRGYRRTAVRRTALPSTDFFRGFFFGVVGSCSTWGCPGPLFFEKKIPEAPQKLPEDS